MKQPDAYLRHAQSAAESLKFWRITLIVIAVMNCALFTTVLLGRQKENVKETGSVAKTQMSTALPSSDLYQLNGYVLQYQKTHPEFKK